MSTRGWRDGYKAPRGRIDARPQNDPAVQAGLRNIHRDTKGNVIGATTPEGRKIGVSGGNRLEAGTGWRGSVTPRLDAGPQTPGLDSQSPPTAAAPSNVKQRQALFADMQKAGAGGLTSEMSQRAQKLGIDQAGWRRGVAKLTSAPASVAASAASAAAPVPMPSLASSTSDKYGPGSSQPRINMNYIPERDGPSMPGLTSAKPVPALPTVPAPAMAITRTPYPAAPATPPPSPIVAQATALRDAGRMLAARQPIPQAGPPASAKNAPSFAVPPVVNPQPVATATPPIPRPAVAAPVAPVTTPAPTVAPVTPAWRKSSNPSFTTAESRYQAREKENAAAQLKRRSAYNKVWNSQPDMPVVDRNSVINKVQKSVRTFLGGNSY